MANKVIDRAKNMFSSIGAMQTILENFPMHLMSWGDLKFNVSFDVLGVLFKMLGIDREEVIENLTNAICGDMKDRSDETGFLAQAEEIVKMALELNIANILNCTTNPIISDDLLDEYTYLGVRKSGQGITINVSELDFTGVLGRSPFVGDGSKYFFDLEDENGVPYGPKGVYKSKDFNAFLWYIINRSDVSQTLERTWDNRYRAAIYGKGTGKRKEIIKCTYIDESYPKSDLIKVQLCGSNYFKTRKLSKKEDKSEWAVNKTIFEFNHEFLSSIKLYEPKVIMAEIIENMLGAGNVTANFTVGPNEQIIEGKIQEIIRKVIEADDTVINDCFFTFSNDEFNSMLEKAELRRYNIIKNGDQYVEVNPSEVLAPLSGMTSQSTLVEDKTIIKNTINELIVTPAKDSEGIVKWGVEYDWQFELLRMLVYPLVRPLFSPKVIFLLLVNQKIMGSLEDMATISLNEMIDRLLQSLFFIIKDIIVRLKDLIVEMILQMILDKLKPLVELFAARLLMETVMMYKDLLTRLLEECAIGWKSNKLTGYIDNVTYADIVPVQTEPEQTIC